MKLELKEISLKKFIGLLEKDELGQASYDRVILNLKEVGELVRAAYNLDNSVVVEIRDDKVEFEICKKGKVKSRGPRSRVILNCNEGSIWPEDDDEYPLEPVQVPNHITLYVEEEIK